MSVELAGPKGILRLEQDGALAITRGDEPILALRRAFIDIFGTTLPVLAIAEAHVENETLLVRFDTGRRDLAIALAVSATPEGFQMAWSAPPPAPTVGLAFSLSTGGPWYGLGERVIQGWPLDEYSIVSEPFGPADFVRDGTLNICTPLWLNAAGAGLWVEEDTGELGVTLNRDSDGLLRIVQRAPEVPPDILEGPVELPTPRLPLRVLIGEHLPVVQRLALDHVGRPSVAPPLELMLRPIWTTWARYKMHITQAQTLEFADEIIAHQFPHSVMEIDDRWQAAYGDLHFDPVKFPEPRAMVEQLHARGFRVTLWVPPFFNPDSRLFREGAAQGYFLCHPATGEPALIRWWQGYGAALDMSNPGALDWWLRGLRRLQSEYGIDGFKFDAGEGNYVPRDVRSAGRLTPNTYADHYVAFVARNFQWTEVRCGWRSQRHGILFREWDKWSRWGPDNGLQSVLTQALQMGLIGYPFVLPDMIGGNAYAGEVPDAELMVRWTQLTALLPSMQFSLAPWDYGAEATEICRCYTQLHQELGPILEQCVAETLAEGTPLVRPLFWHSPDDPAAYTIRDEFTLGERLLVAPVLEAGRRERPIHFPAGRWCDRSTGQEYAGPLHLDAYPAPLGVLPLFERLSDS